MFALRKHLNLGQPINRSNPLMRGIVSRWKVLNCRNTGNRLLDLAGKNHGTLTNGPTWEAASGLQNWQGSLRFAAASTQYVAFPDNNYGIANGYTLAVWHRGNISATEAFFSRDDSGGERFWQFRKEVTSHVATFIRFDSANSVATNISGTTALIDNVWRHIVVTFTGSGSFVYVNGKLEASDAVTTANKDGTGTIPTLGVRSGEQLNEQLTGQLAGVDFFNRGFSASEVYSLYNASRQQFDPTLNWIEARAMAPAVAAGGGNRRRRVIIGANR